MMPDPRLDELRNLILKAKHAYYYSGAPIMSDAEYDALEDQLRLLAPEDPVLALVGAPVSGAATNRPARVRIAASAATPAGAVPGSYHRSTPRCA